MLLLLDNAFVGRELANPENRYLSSPVSRRAVSFHVLLLLHKARGAAGATQRRKVQVT